VQHQYTCSKAVTRTSALMIQNACATSCHDELLLSALCTVMLTCIKLHFCAFLISCRGTTLTLLDHHSFEPLPNTLKCTAKSEVHIVLYSFSFTDVDNCDLQNCLSRLSMTVSVLSVLDGLSFKSFIFFDAELTKFV